MFTKYTLFVAFLLILFHNTSSSEQEELITRWVAEFSRELWNLGKLATKSLEIKSKYAYLNAQIEEKDPQLLLKEIATSISRMMDRKMDAIKCIASKAEDEAEAYNYYSNSTFQYYSSKYSPIVDGDVVQLPDILSPNKDVYKTMSLRNDSHFYNLYVNTSHSSVHVPTNVYDRHKEAQSAIEWSEVLDEVFADNYRTDPALSWQYFGSSSGVLRHYPAMRWIERPDVDVFDCRTRTWFIEAATCTKDIVILLDNSGSMQGMGKHIGALTVKNILETLSNNDYINIISYNVTSKFVVPCFEDTLVQATRENIDILNDAVEKLVPDEKSNIASALERTLELLKEYRKKKNCEEGSADCNQAIMLITDGVPDDLSPIVEKHNRLNNGSNIPIRIFTYSIGKEVTNVEPLIQMACTNRGYYSHVQALEQVGHSVFQYIPVIARPLVLTGENPKSWTHAYTDVTYDDSLDDQINQPYRLLTSVAIPAFDRKANSNNITREAVLLGVAGTDVPIDDIRQLTLPYKIGVNGYAFIVSNNGYLLMHPDLRPVYKKILKKNYNSVDLTEVEQHEMADDDGSQPRLMLPLEKSSVRKLRRALVNGWEDEMTNVTLKYHYDNMRRISRQVYDYYYAPITNTPFSIALALPQGYGKYSLRVEDEIQKNKHTYTNIASFFEGANWRIHPDWAYCKYHYLEGHEYKTSEAELLHFLEKIDNSTVNNTLNFKWQLQYEAYGNPDEEENLNLTLCGSEERTTLKDDDYYCDKQLMQRLIFDAKNTKDAYSGNFTFINKRDEELVKKYNATLRFVATMSGLTRWGYFFEEDRNNSAVTNFGNLHSKAIDEIWYKSAVLQHQVEKEAFVYSVPIDAGDKPNTLVTGSYAIFPNDAGMEAPGSVVGFQFYHADFAKRLQSFTTDRRSCPQCKTCSEGLDCYLLDNSGYILVSGSANNTGRFLGEVRPDVMESMLKEGIFEKIIVYDYQALCFYKTKEEIEMETNNCKCNFRNEDCICPTTTTTPKPPPPPTNARCQEIIEETSEVANSTSDDSYETTEQSSYNGEAVEDEGEEEEEDKGCPCDTRIDLYMLKSAVAERNKKIEDPAVAYYLKLVPHSNLLLVAIHSPLTEFKPFSTAPEKLYCGSKETETHHCKKLNLNELARKRLSGCYNEHPLEHEIKACGGAGQAQVYNILICVGAVYLVVAKNKVVNIV